MRMQILKVVVVLLVAGSGDSRPQNGADSATQVETKEANNVEWRGVQVSNKSQDIVRDDSRYTGTSGSNRKSYVTHFRDSVESSREHNAFGSRTSNLVSNGMARSFSAHRSKINDIWTRPEFKATSAPSDFSRTDILGEIGKIGAIRNLNEANGPSLHGPFEMIINGGKIDWVRSLASNRSSNLGPGPTNHLKKVITKNLEGWRSDAILNQNFKSIVTQMKYSPVQNDFLASRTSGFDKTNDDISSATKNRQKSDSARLNLPSNIRDNIPSRKAEQILGIPSSQIVRTNVPNNIQEGVLTRSIQESHNSIRKNTDKANLRLQTVTSYENLKPNIITDYFHRVDDLNNSGKLLHGIETHSTPIPNSKSGITNHSRSTLHKNAVTFNRNFVKLLYPSSNSNRRNTSNVALNMKLKNNYVRPSVVQLTESTKHHHFVNDHATFEPMKNNHSSHSQNLPSQTDTVGGGNETGDGATSAQHGVYFKNWPNEALEDIEDLYNYDKYTSALEKDSNHDSALQDADRMPILSSDVNYFNHPDPILDSSVKKIIHWLKIPTIVSNGTYFVNNNDDVHKPVESVLESIYENLDPNRPLNIGDHDNNHETVVLQNVVQNQNFSEIDNYGNRPNRWPHPNLIVRPQYVTDSSYPSTTFTPSSWSDVTVPKNKTVYNPLTHVMQNTIVHILNDGPNITATQLKVPESGQTASDSSLKTSSEVAQKPNVQVVYTSQKDANKEPSKQETSPSSIHNTNCPMILINTYTRVNNTIQSKEGCTDLNIVVNSHVTSTNVFEPSDGSLGEGQQTSLATQSYGDAVGSDKYAEEIDDLAYQGSLNNYVTASTGTYGSNPFKTPQPGESDYYDSQRDPTGILEKDPFPGSSTIEVFQGTQISMSGLNVPLTDDAEVTTGPVLTGTDVPAGSSVDGPAVGDDASSSAIDPPAAGASASGSPVAGNPSSINSPVFANVPSVSQELELPVYLIKPGPVKGQANNGLVPGSLQLPSLPNLPNRPSFPIKPELPSVSGVSSASLYSDDEDDDDDFDMSPGGLLQSITSVFTYFTFLNPLGYSFFSLAAAPFAAMAAGVLGVAAIVFPWALPNVLDFGRDADKVTIRFRPNLEEFVRQAVQKYDRLNEWKSRRRKRRSGQSNDTNRNLKDLQYMDQSLRTVATQLLNVTNPQDVIKVNNKEFINVEHVATTPRPLDKNDASLLIRGVNSGINNMESMGVSFGRPINSKFNYFETSHPGQAMAMTEEELEREMSTTRLITAYKNHPTTTGGISTWILLNPPSTTVKSMEVGKTKLKQPFQTEVRLTVKPSSPIERVETITHPEKIIEKITPLLTPIVTTEKVTVTTKKPTTVTTKKITTTMRPERVTQNLEKIESLLSTTIKMVRTTTVSNSTSDETTPSTIVSTTKKSQGTRTTSKPKITTLRTTLHSKPVTTKPTRPNQQNKPKPTPTKRVMIKPEIVKNETFATTGKIEKVTFKPVQIITTPQDKSESTEKSIFVTKIKTSVLMDTQKTPTTLLPVPTATTQSPDITSKLNLSGVDLMEVPVRLKPIGTKVNNVLKVQLKKPVEETTQIEVEPIEVNAPILKIEKVDKNKIDKIIEKDTDDLSNSRIDLKFDFNPELTKINVETQTEVITTSTTTATTSTTTKRPRYNSKRKKNKGRRRKPSTTSMAPSSTTVATMMSTLMETSESITDATLVDNTMQESKIAPETKISPSGTKLKKKQPQKTITTQIYNFLSREVMPSFGMMSLVGLGLGLASYFLYPFGGTITRRNYNVEPNYKYNLDEYGGNYGQNEEEVLSKVLQGMTNNENKYSGVKDFSSSYYHYQHYDGAYDQQTTKKTDARYPSVPTSSIYRPVENTQSAVKYRNTDFRFADTQTTPVYYDRKHPDLAEVAGSANRQFVVGNVPKEYPFDMKAATLPIDSKKGVSYASTEIGQTQFERDIAQGFNFPPNSATNVHNYGHSEVSTIRTDDTYEEIEITPTAVAVEHGPRSLKVKRAITDKGNQHSRLKRESVIQVIPSKHELEEEREEAEKEEDLSNEILDIIDSALPGGEIHKMKNVGENNEVEDLNGQNRKQDEEANTRVKESTMRIFTTVKHVEDVEGTTSAPKSAVFIFKTVEKANDDVSSTFSDNSSDKDTTETHSVRVTSSPNSLETTTVEWLENSTTKKPTEGFSLVNFVKKVAEIKFRLGLTILKHASEGFARYLGHVQKRINGEE